MQSSTKESVMLGVKDIMLKMKIGRDRAYEIIKSNEFHTIKLGRKYYVHEEIFEKWLKGDITIKK